MSHLFAFIPARSGSKRIPKKNIQSFHGKALASWTLEYAQKSQLFDKIFVSTDIPELLTSEDEYPSVSFLERNKNLSGSHTTILEVLLHTAELQGWDDETVVVILQVTAPLRVSSDLTEGLKLFEKYNRLFSVVSVSENLYPPTLLWELHSDYLVSHSHSQDNRKTRKQDHRTTYLWNDILVIDTISGFKKPNRNLFGVTPIPLIIPHERCMPIDYPIQLKLAETLFPPIDERSGRSEWSI